MTQLTKNQAQAAAKEIAKQLGESKRKPQTQIAQIIHACGLAFAESILSETLSVEAAGGLMTINGRRRRTPGGVFFYLARGKMPEDARNKIFPNWYTDLKERRDHESQFPEFVWQERLGLLDAAMNDSGEAEDVKVTLTGRPGAIERHQYLVVTSMESAIPPDKVFPKGVPQPDSEPVRYVTYISSKQWEKVETALEDPKDQLIVEGMCAVDPELGGMAVYATYVTTRRLQSKARKDEAKADSGKRGKGRSKANGSSKSHQRSQQPAPPEPAPEMAIDIPEGMSTADADKLVKLEKAASSFRHKIAGIESRPPDQRFGLEMTLSLLKKTQQQIDDLRGQYND